MTTSGPGSASSTSTYLTTEQTVQAIIVPKIITQSDEIATYFSEDLEEFVRLTHTDLALAFQVPHEYSQNTRDIINMLYEDISHMLRDGLITGIHLVLSDNTMDPGANAFIVRYHAQYLLDNPNISTMSTQPLNEPQPDGRFGGLLAPPKDVWRDSLFALLIDWSPTARNRRQGIRRPDYCFDWVTQEKRFDATNVLQFRNGGLAVDSATVAKRAEFSPPEYQQNI